jgi:hypothetical protein
MRVRERAAEKALVREHAGLRVEVQDGEDFVVHALRLEAQEGLDAGGACES